MTNLKRLFIFLLAAIMCFALAACGEEPEAEQIPVPEPAQEAPPEPEPIIKTASVKSITGEINPYLNELTDGDRTVVEAIYPTLAEIADCTVSKAGNNYNYTYALKDGVKNSNGTEVTSKDIEFALYALMDPQNNAPQNLKSAPVVGMDKFQANMLCKWEIMCAEYAAGTQKPGEIYDENDMKEFETVFDKAGTDFIYAIVDYCVENYADERTKTAVGYAPEKVKEDEGLQIAFSMWCWQTASGLNDEGLFCTLGGEKYDLKTTPPTVADFWKVIRDMYGYDMSEQGIDYEKTSGGQGIKDYIRDTIMADTGVYANLIKMYPYGESSAAISGIKIIDEKTITITTTEEFDGFDDIFIVDMNSWRTYEKGNVLNELVALEPIGAGEYVLKHISTDGAELIPNENYFGGKADVDKFIIGIE